MFPKSLKIIRSIGPLPAKDGGSPLYIGYSEFPNPVPGSFSTVRVMIMSPNPIKQGAEVAFTPGSVDFVKGECRARL